MAQPNLVWFVLEGIQQKYRSDEEASRCYGEIIEALRLLKVLPPKSTERNEETIYVCDIPNDVDEKTIEETFATIGEISDVSLVKKGGANFAFVTFLSKESARESLTTEKYINGVLLHVEMANTKTKRPKRIL